MQKGCVNPIVYIEYTSKKEKEIEGDYLHFLINYQLLLLKTAPL